MIGREVGNYRIVSLIGEGGMGEVYMAEHPTIDRKVAVKVLRADLAANTSVVTRFVNEARVASTLRHPNVIEVFDTGQLEPDHVPYMLMEMLEGESLASRICRLIRIDQDDAIEWTYQIAAALGAAHAKNIVHRDLKPANLFLVADDRIPDREKIKVLDFGIAKVQGALRGSGGMPRTQTGFLLGTPLYMSPEQCRGAKEIDTRSDIYSLGLVMYEMLCGAPPFVSEGMGELISMHLMRPPVPPRAHNPAISEEIEQVVLRALAKEPDNRFATVQDLQRALGYEPSRLTGSGRVSAGVATPRRPSGPMPTLVAPSSIVSAMPPPAAYDAPASPRRTPLPPTRATPQETRSPARPPTGELPVTPARPSTAMVNPSVIVRPSGAVAAAAPPPSKGGARFVVAVVALVGAAVGIGIVSQRKTQAPQKKSAAEEAWELSSQADRYTFPDNDYAHGCPLWEQACTKANLDYSCLRAALCHEQGLGELKKDRNRSCALYSMGCSPEDRSSHSCNGLVECYDAKFQDAPAERLYCDVSEQRCTEANPAACASAGNCYGHEAGGRKADPAKACDLWQRACDSGLADGCGWLATCYASGTGREHDPARALALYKRACEKGTRMAQDGCVSGSQLRKDQEVTHKHHTDAVAQQTVSDTGQSHRPRPRPAPAPKAPEDDDIPVR
jgi:serine/threonine protein kinase